MSDSLAAIISLGLLAFLILLTGVRKGFFKWSEKPWATPIRFAHLIIAFATYFLITFLGTNIAVTFFRKEILQNYIGYSSWMNFILSFSVFLSQVIYLKLLPKEVSRAILKRDETHHQYREDVKNALFSWVLAFPIVLFLSQLFEHLIYKVFHIQNLPDQIAVKFLKSTFETPSYFLLAILSIVVLAPLIEEMLFRGFLQSYIRRHLGAKQAIFITSVCFAMFHFATGQGLGNISIIIPLFVLSLFLGFLYEKQGSILAPMTLHASFNAISVINLYIFGGFTTGL